MSQVIVNQVIRTALRTAACLASLSNDFFKKQEDLLKRISETFDKKISTNHWKMGFTLTGGIASGGLHMLGKKGFAESTNAVFSVLTTNQDNDIIRADKAFNIGEHRMRAAEKVSDQSQNSELRVIENALETQRLAFSTVRSHSQ